MPRPPPFRPYESHQKSSKRRFTVPAPLPLPPNHLPPQPSLPQSAHSLPSPFNSPALPFSPHFNPFLDQLSPFTPHYSPSIFRFPPTASPYLAAAAAVHDWFSPQSPKFPPPGSPLDHPALSAAANAAAQNPVTASLQADNELRRQFLSRLHSTVLKLERKDQCSEVEKPVTNQLSGYQVINFLVATSTLNLMSVCPNCRLFNSNNNPFK